MRKPTCYLITNRNNLLQIKKKNLFSSRLKAPEKITQIVKIRLSAQLECFRLLVFVWYEMYKNGRSLSKVTYPYLYGKCFLMSPMIYYNKISRKIRS